MARWRTAHSSEHAAREGSELPLREGSVPDEGGNQSQSVRPSADGLEGSVPDEGGNQSQSGSVLGGGREVDGKETLEEHESVGHVRLDLCIPPPLGGCGDVVAP